MRVRSPRPAPAHGAAPVGVRPRRRGRAGSWGAALAVLVTSGAVLVAAPGTAVAATGSAADPAPTTLTLSAPAEGYVDSTQEVTLTLARAGDGAPVEGAEVVLERATAGAWAPAGTAVTGPDGIARFDVDVAPKAVDNDLRGTWAGTADLAAATSAVSRISPLLRPSRITLTGPDRIVDESSVSLRVAWVAGGQSVPGTVALWRRNAGGDWTKAATVRLGADGRATVRVRPRVDTRWRAQGPAGRWWQGDRSDVHVLDNVPPGTPVRLPDGAPRPAITLPKQARATGDGAHTVISRIPDRVWRSMLGRSWHRGCPVGRSGLRLVRANYWGFDGYRYRGEIVVNRAIAGKTARALSGLHRARLPLRSMYRVDRFGWSDRLNGADDYRSMRADNTSGFNCRDVVGRPGVRSPHSYGRSVDLNPWENPYRSRQGVVPNRWWLSRSHPRVAWRSRDHAFVQVMREAGFRWTYGLGDIHHFDG